MTALSHGSGAPPSAARTARCQARPMTRIRFCREALPVYELRLAPDARTPGRPTLCLLGSAACRCSMAGFHESHTIPRCDYSPTATTTVWLPKWWHPGPHPSLCARELTSTNMPDLHAAALRHGPSTRACTRGAPGDCITGCAEHASTTNGPSQAHLGR